MARNDIVRASDVGTYVFCARAWWLHRVKGCQPSSQWAMERGETVHLAHGRSVASSVRLKRLAIALLALALVAGLLAIGQFLAI
jgi:hypothetical protein